MHSCHQLHLRGQSKIKVILTAVSSKHLHLKTRIPSDAKSKDVQELIALHPIVFNDLKTSKRYTDIPYAANHIAQIIDHNMEGGNIHFMLTLIDAYRTFAPVTSAEEDMRPAYIMAWCLEMMKSCVTMADDVLDNSPTRRDSTAWHRVGDNNGPVAIRDAIILSYCAHSLMETHFRDKPYHLDAFDVINKMTYGTAVGQYMDVQMTRTFQKTRNFDSLTVDAFHTLVKQKVFYCSWYPWVAVGMLMKIRSRETQRKIDQFVHPILFRMAIMYQYLDDYLDCFRPQGDSFGNDIQCGQVSWLLITAAQMASPRQRLILQECYGIPGKDNIAAVMNVYEELGFRELLKQRIEGHIQDLEKRIQKLPELVPKKIFTNILERSFLYRM